MQRALRHGPQMRRIATVPARLAAAAAKSGLPPQLLPTRSATTPLPTIACRRLPPPQLLPACCCQRAGAALSKPRQPRVRSGRPGVSLGDRQRLRNLNGSMVPPAAAAPRLPPLPHTAQPAVACRAAPTAASPPWSRSRGS